LFLVLGTDPQCRFLRHCLAQDRLEEAGEILRTGERPLGGDGGPTATDCRWRYGRASITTNVRRAKVH
jgi:hypothetical protein